MSAETQQPASPGERRADAGDAPAPLLPRPSPGSLGRHLSMPGQHCQSGKRRSMSVDEAAVGGGGRQPTANQQPAAATSAAALARVRSPSQRLAEISRAYSSGVLRSTRGLSASADDAGRSDP